jgi:putative ABC transport system permease protein
MIRSVGAVLAADVGVNPSRVLTVSMFIPQERYPDAAARVGCYQRLVSRLEAVPGVESVAFGSVPPTETTGHVPYELAGTPPVDQADRPTVGQLGASLATSARSRPR